MCEKGLFKYWDLKVSRQEMRSEISSVIASTISALLFEEIKMANNKLNNLNEFILPVDV